MADFKQAVSLTLLHEGGYTDNPEDPGGATNMGIEQRDLPDIPIKDLTVSEAESFYLERYWKPLYSSINSQAMASKIFDLGVLFGVGTAVRILQSVLKLTEDGIFGPDTLDAVNATAEGTLLVSYKQAMGEQARSIVGTNSTEAEFLTGWLRRINS